MRERHRLQPVSVSTTKRANTRKMEWGKDSFPLCDAWRGEVWNTTLDVKQIYTFFVIQHSFDLITHKPVLRFSSSRLDGFFGNLRMFYLSCEGVCKIGLNIPCEMHDSTVRPCEKGGEPNDWWWQGGGGEADTNGVVGITTHKGFTPSA